MATEAVKSPYVVTEGMARVTFNSQAEAFYNPVQEFNRDLSTAVIQHFISTELKEGKEVSALEALAASGLRSIRYAKEINGLTRIVANDLSDKAVDTIRRNVKDNGVADMVQVSHNDAAMVMYQHRRPSDRFTIVDLDPYGSPTPFLDAAVQCTEDGGLMCITCTDMAVLCGNAPETCYTKYGAICLKSKCCHEMALRIVLQCVESHANRYGRYIEPMLSLSIDFYCRVFVRVRSGQRECKRTTSKLGHVYQCTGCESISVQPLGKLLQEEGHLKYKLVTGPPVAERCEHCGRPYHMGGPFWLGPLHNQTFLSELIDGLEEDKFATHGRMKGMLSVACEELSDVPFYYTQDRLCKMVRSASGKLLDFRSALLNGGYRVSLSHANKLALKTDAPNQFVWDMMRAWEKEHPVNRDKLSSDSVAYVLLSAPQKNQVSFELHPEANPVSRALQLKRFQVNPERNWGPKNRAIAGTFVDDNKRIRNQGKKRKKTLVAEESTTKRTASVDGADLSSVALNDERA